MTHRQMYTGKREKQGESETKGNHNIRGHCLSDTTYGINDQTLNKCTRSEFYTP